MCECAKLIEFVLFGSTVILDLYGLLVVVHSCVFRLWYVLSGSGLKAVLTTQRYFSSKRLEDVPVTSSGL